CGARKSISTHLYNGRNLAPQRSARLMSRIGLAAACHGAPHALGRGGHVDIGDPRGANASTPAFQIAGGATVVPAPPQPLAPSGLCVQSVVLVSSLNGRKLSARGMQ